MLHIIEWPWIYNAKQGMAYPCVLPWVSYKMLLDTCCHHQASHLEILPQGTLPSLFPHYKGHIHRSGGSPEVW